VNNEILEELRAIPGLKLECPSCTKKFGVEKATIFDSRDGMPDEAIHIIACMKGRLVEQHQFIKDREAEIVKRRRELNDDLLDGPGTTRTKTAGINFGQMVENIVPSFRAFPYNPKDCRQLFDPIDYIVFKGLSKGDVQSITFADVKTGTSRLNAHQKSIKSIIEEGKISFSVMGGSK